MGTVHSEFTIEHHIMMHVTDLSDTLQRSLESAAMRRNQNAGTVEWALLVGSLQVAASDGLGALNLDNHLFPLQPHGGLIRSA